MFWVSSYENMPKPRVRIPLSGTLLSNPRLLLWFLPSLSLAFIERFRSLSDSMLLAAEEFWLSFSAPTASNLKRLSSVFCRVKTNSEGSSSSTLTSSEFSKLLRSKSLYKLTSTSSSSSGFHRYFRFFLLVCLLGSFLVKMMVPSFLWKVLSVSFWSVTISSSSSLSYCRSCFFSLSFLVWF